MAAQKSYRAARVVLDGATRVGQSGKCRLEQLELVMSAKVSCSQLGQVKLAKTRYSWLQQVEHLVLARALEVAKVSLNGHSQIEKARTGWSNNSGSELLEKIKLDRVGYNW